MKKQPLMRNLILVLLPLLAVALAAQAQEQPNPDGLIIVCPRQRYTETIPVIDIHAFGYQPMMLPAGDPINHSQFTIHHSQLNRGGGSDPNNPYAIIRKTGPTFIQPGGTARYDITLANYESITHTYHLVDTLPPGLFYIPDSATGLAYESATRTLSWQGELAPGNLEYIIEEHSPALPYLDLANFGAENGYSRTFSYEAVVNVPVPETIASTAVVISSSADPALATAWSTHYLYVRHQLFLPLASGGSE